MTQPPISRSPIASATATPRADQDSGAATPPAARNAVKLANVAIRAATLGSRFLFVFALARFVEPAVLGMYGLFTATVGYALYFLGLDFYTYTTREILRVDRQRWAALLKNQAALTGLLYAVFLPLSAALFVTGSLPLALAPWFYVLLLLEHVNQELSRLLTAISEQIMASVVLFLRQGSWAIAIVACMLWTPDARHLNHIFAAWSVASTLAALLALHRLRRMGLAGWRSSPVDWAWIRRGIIICLPLLLATLALRGLFTFDRYLLNHFGGLETVGAYVLFFGIAGTMMAFLEAGVFAYAYPELISAHQGGQTERFRRTLRHLLNHTIIFAVLFTILSLMLLGPLLRWIGKPLYLAHAHIYGWLLLAMTLNALSMVPHYALYAQDMDRPIIHSHLLSLAVFLPAAIGIGAWFPAVAVPVALCLAFLSILVWKAVVLYKRSPAQYLAAATPQRS